MNAINAHMEELRIAIVDDSRAAAETLAEYFKSHGVIPTVFTSCEELLALDADFDAVVTDTNLGLGMSGFDCAKNIRERMSNAVIIGTSVVETERDNEYRTIYLRSGADSFINRIEGGSMIAQHVVQLLSGR